MPRQTSCAKCPCIPGSHTSAAEYRDASKTPATHQSPPRDPCDHACKARHPPCAIPRAVPAAASPARHPPTMSSRHLLTKRKNAVGGCADRPKHTPHRNNRSPALRWTYRCREMSGAPPLAHVPLFPASTAPTLTQDAASGKNKCAPGAGTRKFFDETSSCRMYL
jgi:hypothetical protein